MARKRTTLRELVTQAVGELSPRKALRVAQICRVRLGMDYRETHKFVSGIAPIELAEWDGLLYAAEDGGAR